MRVRCGVVVEDDVEDEEDESDLLLERREAKAESRSSWFFSGRNCAILRIRGSRD